jgi:hypothetical protein
MRVAELKLWTILWDSGLSVPISLRYSHNAKDDTEGSHNGIAAVLKTAGRKAMQVRLLSPPPLIFR